ncbi:cyclin-dependent kinase inhibitor 1B [Grus japonensis]|uniref:Cyclin-dependent kinase inhibitor 1B n=1 Tax=Grus japonensis TaxID=30415 RepID=A0ABC9VWV0_GRUJA
MSNVRISNGSPTLERMEARQSEYPKPSACRNLFGPVNNEELNRDLKKHFQEMEEAYQRKWNFDFQNHKPLEGRYEWQAVEKGSSPEFYFRPPRLLKAVCKSSGRQSLDIKRLVFLKIRRTLQSSALGRGKDLPPMIPLLKLKEPTQQKKRVQQTPPVPVQWSKHPRNQAQDDIKRKPFRAEDVRVLVHRVRRGAMKRGRCKVVVETKIHIADLRGMEVLYKH